MKNKKPLLAILISLTAGPIIESYTMLMKHFGLTNITASEALSMMFQKEPNQVIGIIGVFTILVWYFLFIYYSADLWGTEYLPLKAMLISMTGESLHFNVFGVLTQNKLMIQSVSGNFVHASAAAIAGLWVGFLYQKYLFKNGEGKTLKADQPLLAITIGWVGLLISEGVTQLAKLFGFVKLSALEAASLMWLYFRPSLVLGVLSLLGLGAWIGLLIYYSVNLWGKDYFPIKAALIFWTCQSLIFQFFGVLGGNELLLQGVSGTFSHAIGGIIGGLVVGFVMKKFLWQRTSESGWR